MAEQVMEGGSYGFVVVVKNKFGTVLTPTDVTVALSDASLGTVSASPDGKTCAFTAAVGVQGTEVLTATSGGVSSDPYPVAVVPDTTVASVTIQPAAPATVAVQPAPATTPPATGGGQPS